MGALSPEPKGELLEALNLIILAAQSRLPTSTKVMSPETYM